MSKAIGNSSVEYYSVDDRNPSGYAQMLDEYQGTYLLGPVMLARSYTYGLALISEQQLDTNTLQLSKVSYYGYDGHGNVRLLLGTNGGITDAYTYDAFGNIVASMHTNSAPTPNNYLYCGQQFDADLGLYYNRARYLNIGTGRFWSADSTGGHNEDPLSLHKYLYGADNPVNGSDPSGHDDLADTIEAASNFDSLPLGSIAVLKRTVATRMTIAQRSASYLYDDYELNTDIGAIPCRWFRAAQIVTGRRGVGAADYSAAENLFLLDSATASYLQYVNRLLFVWNIANFLSLANGQEIPGLSGHRGKALDYGLVDFEQQKVQAYTSSYFSDPNAKSAAITKINSLTNGSGAPDEVKSAILIRFTGKGKTYSFDSLSDREQLGYGIVDWVYQFTSPFDYAGVYR